MNDNFRKIETDILEWVSKNTNDTRLKDQIKSAVFVEREWTKVGFYVDFKVDKSLEPVADIKIAIDGPILKSQDIEHEGHSMIWEEDGYINCIEMVANGSFFKEDVTDYSLLTSEQYDIDSQKALNNHDKSTACNCKGCDKE